MEYDFVRRDWLDENLVFELKSHPPLATLPSFQHGLFYVQDPSTFLAVSELDPQPGETILDLCAAPGGKTTYIAQLMENRGKLVAQTLHSERLKFVQENCARLGVTCVETVSQPFPAAQFDRILVDAPCSNTGVLRRRVDLRWRIRPEEIERLQDDAAPVAAKAAALLKPGGTLVYSTCSLEPEENQDVLVQFSANNLIQIWSHQLELQPVRDGDRRSLQAATFSKDAIVRGKGWLREVGTSGRRHVVFVPVETPKIFQLSCFHMPIGKPDIHSTWKFLTDGEISWRTRR